LNVNMKSAKPQAKQVAKKQVADKVKDQKKEKVRAGGKAERFQKATEDATEETGLIYVGHLPYGFVEDGLKEFFTQYGDVTKVKLMRSKKSARSKGYGFVEFQDPEVAKIAATSMNGYMMYGRPLEVRYVEAGERNKFQLIRSDKKFKFVPWQIIYRKGVNNVNFFDADREG
jgi:nucleolar protein 15